MTYLSDLLRVKHPAIQPYFLQERSFFNSLQSRVNIVRIESETYLTERMAEIETLPDLCLIDIISFLEPADFFALRQVSKTLYQKLSILFLQKWGAYSDLKPIMTFCLRHINDYLLHADYQRKANLTSRDMRYITTYQDRTFQSMCDEVEEMLQSLAEKGDVNQAYERLKDVLSYYYFNSEFEFICYLLDFKDYAEKNNMSYGELCEHYMESKRRLLNNQEMTTTENPKRLFSIPLEIKDHSSLKSLQISSSSLGFVPPEIGALHYLNDLDLSYNQLTFLPCEIARLTALKKLNLARNIFGSFPPDIATLVNLEDLTLWNCGLTELSPLIGSCWKLKRLELGGNQLSALPYDMKKLTQLKSLNLSLNHFQALPRALFGLVTLERLDLSHNQLQTLPRRFTRLIRLERLEIHHNRLTYIHPAVVHMRSLTYMAIISQTGYQDLYLAICYLSRYRRVPTRPEEFELIEAEQARYFPVRWMREAIDYLFNYIVPLEETF